MKQPRDLSEFDSFQRAHNLSALCSSSTNATRRTTGSTEVVLVRAQTLLNSSKCFSVHNGKPVKRGKCKTSKKSPE